MNLYLFFSLAIALLAGLFAVQNNQVVRVSFLSWFFESPMVVVLLLTFSAGALTALLASLPGRIRTFKELKDLRRTTRTDLKETPIQPIGTPPEA